MPRLLTDFKALSTTSERLQRPGPGRRLQLEKHVLYHSSLLEDGWEEEAQETRGYFMLTLLFGVMPEYSAVREEGKIISAAEKTELLRGGNLL